VEHPHFWLEMTFIRSIRIVYRNAQRMVKVKGTLTAPFKYARGVRQGDPHIRPTLHTHH
jgi:hypothetical protein